MSNAVIDNRDLEKDYKIRLADYQHDIWSHWMRYMFTCGVMLPDGSWGMPPTMVKRWQRQMNTPFDQLTRQEQASDLEQVDKFWQVVKDFAAEKHT